MALRALLWDVDGTLAETERDGHRVAFNAAFEDCGEPWRWDETEYGALLEVTGGRERVLHYLETRGVGPSERLEREALASRIHAAKNLRYAERVARVPLRLGVFEVMQACRARGLKMAIATTTSRANVGALLRVHLGPDWTDWFAATVCGEDVGRKKPDPEVYRVALGALRVDAHDAVAVEDSPAGVAAASAAGVPVVVTRSSYFGGARFDGALAVGPGFDVLQGWQPAPARCAGRPSAVGLADIERWHARAGAGDRPLRAPVRPRPASAASSRPSSSPPSPRRSTRG